MNKLLLLFMIWFELSNYLVWILVRVDQGSVWVVLSMN